MPSNVSRIGVCAVEAVQNPDGELLCTFCVHEIHLHDCLPDHRLDRGLATYGDSG